MRGPQLSFGQERERRELRQAFEMLLPDARLVDFDDERFVGTHENIDGVQWHVALDRAEMTSRFAVNLEGLAYGGTWPIARFLQHEAEDTGFLSIVARVERPESVLVHIARDTWKGPRMRVAADNWNVLRARPLTELKATTWRDAVAEAQRCLADRSGGRGVASLIRIKTGVRERLETTPHFNVGITLLNRASLAERVMEMRRAVQRLAPIHEFVNGRCV